MTTLSRAEQQYIMDGLSQGLRLDGSKPWEFQDFEMETEVIPTAEASVRFFSQGTEVISTVKLDLVAHDDPAAKRLLLNVESPGAPATRRATEEWTTWLASHVEELCFANDKTISHALELQPAGHFAWVVYVDVLIVACQTVSFDLVSLAVVASLNQLRLPNTTVVKVDNGERPEDATVQVRVDSEPWTGRPFPSEKIPLLLTVGVHRGRLLWGMSKIEEQCAEAEFLVAVDREGCIQSIRKMKGELVDLSLLKMVSQTSKTVGKKIHAHLLQRLPGANDCQEDDL